MNISVSAHPSHPLSHFPLFAISHILTVLEHLLHTASACTPFINSHLHNHMSVSCVGELTFKHEPLVSSVNVLGGGGCLKSRRSLARPGSQGGHTPGSELD